MSDTISKDPRMQEEARRAAAGIASAVNMPELPYNREAIAREEFNKRVDQNYLPKSPVVMTFEMLWELLTKPLAQEPTASDILFALSESEYRQLVGSLFRRVNSMNLELAARSELQNAESLHASAILSMEDRLGVSERGKLVDSIPDVLRGIMRKSSTLNLPRVVRPLHPNGCPDVSSGVQAVVQNLEGLDLDSSSPVAQAIKEALDRIVGSRKR